MSNPSLSQVVLEVCDRYQQAASSLLQAYQTGVERAARDAQSRFATGLQARALLFVEDSVKTSLIAAAQHVSDVVVARTHSAGSAMSAANERLNKGVKSGVERVADVVGRVDTAFNSKAAQTLSLLGLPSAQLSLSVANAVAGQAERLQSRVAAEEPVAEVKATAKKSRAAAQD